MKQHEIIRKRLKELNYSAYWLAEKTGRTPQYISRAVRGDTLITSTDLIASVAKALNLDPDILYTSAGRLPPDIIQAILAYPQFIPVIRDNYKRMEATKK